MSNVQTDDERVRALYQRLLDAWNAQDAQAFGAVFADDATLVGFDGSQMTERATITETLGQIFADHPTARYVYKVRFARKLAQDAALLYAVVGMIPRGQTDLVPALNAIQTLTATRQGDDWRAVHFQNTQAQFHGRPDLVDALTAELRALVS